MNMIEKNNAILALVKNAQFTNRNNVIEWLDERPQPTEEEINAKIAELEAAEPLRLLRIERNRLLQETDWRMTEDYPNTDKETWKIYRQSLRDLPTISEPQLDEFGNLTNVNWPEKPE